MSLAQQATLVAHSERDTTRGSSNSSEARLIWGDPEVTGKPAGGDLTSRKKSLPVVAALTSGTTPGDQLARLYRREDPDEQGMARAARLIEDAGGRDWAWWETTRQVQQALDHMTSAKPARGGAADLRLLAGLVLRRSL